MSAPDPHPSATLLTDFLLGKLSDHESGELETHLTDCHDCQFRAATLLPEDTLVSLLAAAGTRDTGERSTGTATLTVVTPDEVAVTEAYQAPAAPPANTPPELTGHPRYRIVCSLGAGGMGAVWLAEHTVMGRAVALKVIRPEFLSRPGAVERFRREVRAAAQLHHPNIITAFDADEAGGAHFLVMEYVPGEPLSDVVRRGPFPVVEACRACRDAALGLAHAHAAGFVHRDIKPGNLIRATDGTVKVLDFGLVTMGASGEGLTGEQIVMGTPDYIAPEQAEDARSADARSDVYSLGCTLHHLLAGRVPYPGGSALQKLDAHRDPGRQPGSIPEIPAALAAVLAKMTAKNPANRYPTTLAVAAALEPFCSATGAVGPPPRRPRRRVVVALALLVLAGLAAGGVLYKIERDNEVITIEADDPDIEIVMKRNGELVRIVDRKTDKSWELDTKKLRLSPGGALTIDLPGGEPLVIRRNGDVAVVIRRQVKPAPAIPPAAKPPAPATIPVLKAYRVLKGHTELVRSAIFSADGKTVYSCGDDGFVIVWDVETGRETARFGHRGRAMNAALVDGGRTLLVGVQPKGLGGSLSSLIAWDLTTGKEAAPFPKPQKPERLSHVVGSPNGKQAAVLLLDGTVQVWDIAGRKLLRTWNAKGPLVGANYYYHCAWSPDGRHIAVAGDNGLSVWVAETGTLVHRFPLFPTGLTGCGFTPDGRWVLASAWDGMIRGFDLTNWQRVAEFPASKYAGTVGATRWAVTPNSRYWVGGCLIEGTVRDLVTDRIVARLEGHELVIHCFSVSADGTLAVSVSDDKTVRVWRLSGVTTPREKP